MAAGDRVRQGHGEAARAGGWATGLLNADCWQARGHGNWAAWGSHEGPWDAGSAGASWAAVSVGVRAEVMMDMAEAFPRKS
jgi:hypothetical protein